MRALLLACFAIVLARPADAHHTTASSWVKVEIRGFRSDKGKALVALFAAKKGFPDKPAHALRRAEVTIQGGTARATFAKLPAGTYAVAVLHDEDGNKSMKTGLFGIPKEGYGASQDARGDFGPPSFGDAKFDIRAGRRVTTRIKLVYH